MRPEKSHGILLSLLCNGESDLGGCEHILEDSRKGKRKVVTKSLK